jgi:PTS system mannose-specific IIA component
MIGILIITHGRFGYELLKSAELIVGHNTHAQALGLDCDSSIDRFKVKVTEAIRNLDKGDGVLVFVDLYGGSPFNAAALNLSEVDKKFRFECITGVNLPMVLEALTMRSNLKIGELKQHCIEAGISGIKDLVKEVDMTG